jgi:predicted phosphodiesterase
MWMSLSDSYDEAKSDAVASTGINSIERLLKANGLTPEDVGKISKVSLSNNPDDTKIILSPSWVEGPKWQPVQQAAPTIVQPKVRTPALISSSWKVAVALPDPQIGYRRYEDGTLDPFHDEDAMDVALQVIGLDHGHPVDQIINLGDFLDLPMYGTYEQEAVFAHTAQIAIDRGHLFLAEQRAEAGADARIILLEGNHDKRLMRFINTNAAAAFGLRVANKPDSWPVNSLQNLLRCDELGVEFIDGYPAAAHWINKRLRAMHGDRANASGSTAAQYANSNPNISTLFGHTHRMEQQSKTVFDRDQAIKSVSFSPGCLCRVDGAVPSVKGGVDIKGQALQYFENWQQGVSVIFFKDGDDDSFHFDQVHIHKGKTMYRGQEIVSTKLAVQ